MQVSYQIMISNAAEIPDYELYKQEMGFALLAEPLGFDAIWCVEHHFDAGYSMSPDNFVILSYLAGQTKTINLVTGAVILPWNDPLRVAEKVALLDNLCDGRLIFGMGRGLAKGEYECFDIDMNESRQRFDESARMVIKALESGYIEGSGPFYPQPKAPIRPGQTRSFRDRMFCIAQSADSRVQAAELGLGMATFLQYEIEKHAVTVNEYRDNFRKLNGREAPPPTFSDNVYCSADPQDALETSRDSVMELWARTSKHYGFGETHFANTKGYESYQAMSNEVINSGMDAASEAFWKAQSWGTPDQILETIKHRYDVIGDHNLNIFFSYGGLDPKKVESSMRLFAKEVLPEVKKLGVNATVGAK